MSKPDRALEVSTPCDLSKLAVEYAMEPLRIHIQETYGLVDHMSYLVRVHLGNVLCAVQELQPFGIPVMIDSSYRDVDEWSLVASGFIYGPPVRHIKAEIWSPGA